MDWVWVASGFVLLIAGGEALVRGAGALAGRLGVSPLLIGLVVVGFGTSTPELVTSLQAALAGSPGIAIGNVVGSNIANILLILGLSALIWPIDVDRRAFRRDGPVLILASLAAVAVLLTGAVTRTGGVLLLVGLAGYLVWAYRSDAVAAEDVSGDAILPPTGLPMSLVLAAGGIALTILGARWLVAGATGIATDLGVSEAVIGLTIVAVGTSLPELVTGVMAALRRQGALAFGNVVGSNIYNVLGILGVTAVVSPLAVPAGIAGVDAWVMLGAAGALVAMAVTGWRISRGEGAVLLALYAGYLGWLAAGQV